MDGLNWKELEQIPIPEGLEERLEKKIDEWEKTLSPALPHNGEGAHAESLESKLHSLPLHRRRGAATWFSIAASFALIFGVGFYFLSHDKPVNLAEQDTYQDPVNAQQEAEKALNLLAYNLNKGMGQLEKAKAISDRTEKTLNKQLNILK
ncbi:MAG: hypothetical protein IJR02_02815 [Bacteroidaceae bacterium]|nr:hypothetical protein [Bacteroidaceae bacterium]